MDKYYNLQLNYKELLPIINEILEKAIERKELTWTYKQIRSCPCCDKKYDYYRYPRNSRYHSKGDCNYGKPIYYPGYKFFEGFITVKGSGDICCDCEEKYNVIKTLIDYIIDNDLKIEIQNNEYKFSKYIKDKESKCPFCGETFKESEITKEKYGDRYCPHCGQKETPFKKIYQTGKTYELILNPIFGQEVIINEVKELIKKYNESNTKKISLIKHGKRKNIYIIHEECCNADLLTFDIKNKQYKTINFDDSIFIEANYTKVKYL